MSSTDPVLSALNNPEERLVGRLSEETDRQFAAMSLGINGRFDAIELRLDQLQTEYQMILV